MNPRVTQRADRAPDRDEHKAPIADVAGSGFSAAIYEPFLWLGERRGMRERRRALLSGARGRVLEIGAGTGLNLPLYPDELEQIVLAEPVTPMAERIERRLEASPVPAEVVIATAEELPFADGSFDTVVSTLVLCTVADTERALAEIARVLRPGGRLLFCEHVRSDSPRLARWQRRLARPWAAFAEGCRCDQDTISAISARFSLKRSETDSWNGMPPLVRPLVVGEALA